MLSVTLYALCMHEGSKPSTVPYRRLRYGFASTCQSYLVSSSNISGVLEKELDASPKHSYPQQEPSAEGYVIKARGSTKQEGRSNEASTAGSRLGNASLSASDVAVHIRTVRSR